MSRGYLLLSRRNQLIPRVEVEGRRRSYKKVDLDDPFDNGGLEIEYTPFTAVECVIQPIRGKALRDQNNQLTTAGEEDYDSYTVYSETVLYRAQEGTDKLSDQLCLPNSVGENSWFTVMKADRYPSAGNMRYRYYLIAVPVGTEGGL